MDALISRLGGKFLLQNRHNPSVRLQEIQAIQSNTDSIGWLESKP